MKKLMFMAAIAMVLTVFNACQKDELVEEQLQTVASVGELPDVYVENGYLAFKNINVVDSVMNVLMAMSRDEREAWDARMGFKSAYADFEKLFDEYEQLSSQEEFLVFKKKYQARLTFNDADPEDNSIDYPFVEPHFASILNDKGLMKIGLSIYVFQKENYKIILDGDLAAINRDGDDKNVLAFGSRLKSSSVTMLHDFPEDHPNKENNRWYENGKRRLLNELKVVRFINKLQDNGSMPDYYEYGYKYYLQQRAQKKSWGSWNDYKTTYSLGQAKFKVNTQNTFKTIYTYISPEVRPNADFNLYLSRSYGNFTYEPSLSIITLPSKVSFSGYTSCRGIDPETYLIDHTEHTGWDLEDFNNPLSPQPFYWSTPY